MASKTYNIAITAGGTSEDVDGVRKLTNVSTGSLGWNCLEATLDYFLLKHDFNFRIFYILTPKAFRKKLMDEHHQYVDFIEVSDAESVYQAVDKLTQEVNITHFIHSMAISDFTFSYAVSVDALAEELASHFNSGGEMSSQKISEILNMPQSRFEEGAKISSSKPMLLGLKTTRKVISLIKKNNSNTVLVGFKLLRNVDDETLMNVAGKLQNENNCDYVFANELSNISGDDHKGMLIKGSDIVARAKGKRMIAEVIVETMLNNK